MRPQELSPEIAVLDGEGLPRSEGGKTEATFLRYNIVIKSDLHAGAQKVQRYLGTLPTKAS